MQRRIMMRGRLLICAVLTMAAFGCRGPENVPMLTERSIMEVKLIIETDPPGSLVYGEKFEELGKAPVTKTWRFEKLLWSNGEYTFRFLPKGTRIEIGEQIPIEVTVKTEGRKKMGKRIVFPFSGKSETITRKITLK